MKKHFRLLSSILIITMLMTIFPVQAFADGSDSSDRGPEVGQGTVVNQNTAEKDAKIIGEVVGKREANVKTFLKDDMTYEADIYPYPVHYMENGQWKDADNTLSSAVDEEGNNVLQNKDNDYKIKIAKNTKAKKLVKLQKGNYEIDWNIENANDSTPEAVPVDTNSLSNLSDNDKIKTLTKVSSIVNFKNIFDNIDFQYQIRPGELKENIIINSQVDSPRFTYDISVKNVIAKLLDDNSIVFYDAENTSKVVFKMDSPFMYDANYEESKNIQISLDKTDSGYKLALTPDESWLNSSDRKYPVTVDPPIQTNLNYNYIDDSYVCSSFPTTNYYTSYIERVGWGSTSGSCRSYLKFILPTLQSGDLITSASLRLIPRDDRSDPYNSQIDAHEVTSSWNSGTITWNNMPSYNTTIKEYQIIGAYQAYSWDITSIAKDWYSSGVNNGLMLRYANETPGNDFVDEFYSSDTSSSYIDDRPVVTLCYTNNSGLEDYWTYHSQDVGRAGTGYVNDYNGNLIFSHNDLSMNGSRMPLVLNHVYNSNDKDTNLGYGNGWMLSLSQKVSKQTYSGIAYYDYTDEDGTIHYLRYDSSSGTYIDEAGTNLTLTENTSNSTETIKDNKNNRIVFTSAGYLLQMIDSNNNTLTLHYTGTTLTSVTDGAGRVTNLSYNTNGNLSTITDPSGRMTTFGYTGSQLTKITYPDNTSSTYTYDSSNKLTSAMYNNGYKIVYTYYTVNPYRISKVQETNNDGTLGQQLNVSYGYNETTFTDGTGRKNMYQFNDYGNTVSIKDANGDAQYYKYSTGSNINKLSLQSKLQQTVINLLKDHDIETGDSWNADYWSGSTGSGSITTEAKYLGNQSLKIVKTNNQSRQLYNQTLTLTKGQTYTFSGYIKTSGVSNTNNKGAALFVDYQNSAGTWQTIDGKYVNETSDWQRYELTFTLPSDAASTTVYIRAGIIEETGTAYFDSLQLEEGSIANRYNLVENQSFGFNTGTPLYWGVNGDCSSADATSTGANIFGSQSFKMNGVYGKEKYLYQNINVSGKKGDAFVVSGWAYGNPVPTSSGTRYYALDLVLRSSSGDQVTIIPFNQDCSNWQYLSDTVLANNDYTSATLYILYYNQSNSVYFDGLQLYKEQFGQSYTYDANGNVTSIADLANQNSTFQYTNNDLTKAIDPKGNQFTYSYDGNHNLLNATSAENVVYTFSYDSSGNPLTAEVGNSTLFNQSTAAYSSSGNYIQAVKDSQNNTVKYNYNEQKGTLDTETDANGKTTSYSYNPQNDQLTGVSKTAGGRTASNSYTYENDRIKAITSNNNQVNYNFGYDSLGNNTTVSVGSQNLVTNSYNNDTGTLSSSLYGNGQSVSYGYDLLDRLTSMSYNGNPKFTYQYDASGNIGYSQDLVNSVNYNYVYDLSNRLVEVNGSDGSKLDYQYDANNNTTQISDKVGTQSTPIITRYDYDKDDRQKTVYGNNGSTTSFVYDILGRLQSRSISTGTANYTTSYGYKSGAGTNSTANRLETITNNGSPISYTYDANGNIKTITQGSSVISYTYDELNEVTREDNQVLNKSIVYAYDAGGNLLTKTEYPYTAGTLGTPTRIYNYSYGNSNWKDELTGYDGNSITYDAIGNPSTYNGWTYTWEEGRQLSGMSNSGTSITYKYNDDGIRTQKTVNGVTTKYHLVGDTVTSETNGTDTIKYTYDADGDLVSMNLNGTEYYYIYDGVENIIGLFDSTGTQVVSYTYDTWGKLISITGSLAGTVGVKNPYRYHGYRYDTETGLYYLQSRYYNPEWGRFINADAIAGSTGELLGHNLFAYCKNNPANMSDENGSRPVFENEEDEEIYYEKVHEQREVIDEQNSGIFYYKEHTKGARQSTKQEHQEGQSRKQRDAGGEKGDARRKPKPNRRRAQNRLSDSLNSLPWLNPVLGTVIIVGTGTAALIIISDDITGVGVSDDAALVPLVVIFEDAVKMVGYAY